MSVSDAIIKLSQQRQFARIIALTADPHLDPRSLTKEACEAVARAHVARDRQTAEFWFLLASALSEGEASAAPLLEAGQSALARGRSDEALKHFRAACAAKPEDPLCWERLASAALAAANNDVAESALARSLQIMPDWPQALYSLARLRFASGESEAGRRSIGLAVYKSVEPVISMLRATGAKSAFASGDAPPIVIPDLVFGQLDADGPSLNVPALLLQASSAPSESVPAVLKLRLAEILLARLHALDRQLFGRAWMPDALAALGGIDVEATLERSKEMDRAALLCAEAASQTSDLQHEAAKVLALLALRRGEPDGARVALASVALETPSIALLRVKVHLASGDAEAARRAAAITFHRSPQTFNVARAVNFVHFASMMAAPVVQLTAPSSRKFAFSAFTSDGQRVESTVLISEPAVAASTGGQIIIRDGIVFSPDGGFLVRETLPVFGGYETGSGIATQGTLSLYDPDPPTMHIDGPCLVLGGHEIHHANYFHWMVQVLAPTAAWLSQNGEPADVKVLIPAELRSVFRESLAMIGFTANRCVEVPGKATVRLDNAVLLSPPLADSNASSPALDALRQKLLANSMAQPRKPASEQRPLFVTRGPGTSRPLLNQAALVAMARKKGLCPVDPAKLSLSDQIHLFSRAAAIVGVAGAGLTNMLFSPAGTQIMAIAPRETARLPFMALSASLGHEYCWVLGKALPESLSGAHFPDCPFSVSEDVFEAALATV